MTSPYAHRPPPLTDLPAPRRLPREATNLIPPGEIIAESKRAILRRLVRVLWAPALVLLGLWYLLLVLYVVGASPTFWFFSLLATLGEPAFFRTALTQLGFTSSGLTMAFLLLPAAATALSLAVAPLAPLSPRRAAAAPLPQRTAVPDRGVHPRHRRAGAPAGAGGARRAAQRGAGPAAAVERPRSGAAVLLVPGAVRAAPGLGAGAPVRPCLEAAGITDATTLQTTARIGQDLERRKVVAKQVREQDRRHLPPNLGTPALSAAATPRGALVALARIARASLVWVLPAAAGTGWLVFGITDLVTVFVGISTMDLTSVSSPLRWQHAVVGAPIMGMVLLGVALAPALAVPLAATQRDQVRDQRTYEDWNQRARANPWEARVVGLTGWISAAWGLLGTVLAAIVLQLMQVATAFSWVSLILIALVLVPLLGFAAAAGMRSGLRDVL